MMAHSDSQSCLSCSQARNRGTEQPELDTSAWLPSMEQVLPPDTSLSSSRGGQPWEYSRVVCRLQVSTKTSVLVTHQMLFMFSKWREVWGRPSLHRGGGVHPPHLYCVDLLPLLGMWQQGNPVRPEKLLIVGEGEQDKGAAHGFVVQKVPGDQKHLPCREPSSPGAGAGPCRQTAPGGAAAPGSHAKALW